MQNKKIWYKFLQIRKETFISQFIKSFSPFIKSFIFKFLSTWNFCCQLNVNFLVDASDFMPVFVWLIPRNELKVKYCDLGWGKKKFFICISKRKNTLARAAITSLHAEMFNILLKTDFQISLFNFGFYEIDIFFAWTMETVIQLVTATAVIQYCYFIVCNIPIKLLVLDRRWRIVLTNFIPSFLIHYQASDTKESV